MIIKMYDRYKQYTFPEKKGHEVHFLTFIRKIVCVIKINCDSNIRNMENFILSFSNF